MRALNDPAEMIQEGIAVGFQGDYQGAVDNFEQAIYTSTFIESDKKHVAWFNKGQALMQMEKYREAIEAFDKAIKYDADDEFSWFYESVSYLALERFKEALECADKAI